MTAEEILLMNKEMKKKTLNFKQSKTIQFAFSKEQRQTLDKLDELLCLRESKENSLRQLNQIIKQGIKKANTLPERWYVRSPQESVIEYLEKKYNKTLTDYKNMPVGYGELHGEFAFIPHDVSYSWEITQDEFNYAMSLIKETTKEKEKL